MSIELNWEALTSGPDGEALAERIRAFIHDKFQAVTLPRFISSVKVHGFEFGSVAPSLALKDLTDPLPEFYTAALDDEESDSSDEDEPPKSSSPPASGREPARASEPERSNGDNKRRPAALRPALWRNNWPGMDSHSPFLGTSTPGLLGGPGLNYFQNHMGSGGTQTPLAAVAGAHLTSSWLGSANDPVRRRRSASEGHTRQSSQSHLPADLIGPGSPENERASAAAAWAAQSLREKSSVSTLAPSSDGTSRPPTRGTLSGAAAATDDEHMEMLRDSRLPPSPPRRREPRPDDMQAIFRIRYAGDVRLQLTAEILLDYPMPSFVSIPLKLNITGLSFDGVGVLAYIRRRVHFCFLSPEDAVAAVGRDDDEEDEDGDKGEAAEGAHKHGGSMGGLLQEIRVESEIGERDGGKQSLKNVGKVERFVLEQVRRIFEEEFVYPSFWTFLV